MTIDWDKPIRFADNKQPVKLVATLDGRERRRLCVFNNSTPGREKVGDDYNSYEDDTKLIENIPDKREVWVNLFINSSSNMPYMIVGRCFSTREDALSEIASMSVITHLKTIKIWEGEVK